LAFQPPLSRYVQIQAGLVAPHPSLLSLTLPDLPALSLLILLASRAEKVCAHFENTQVIQKAVLNYNRA
jgi:hypothetical protein